MCRSSRGSVYWNQCHLKGVVPGEVAPLVGAWIEIEEPEYERLCNMVAPLVGTWIEILQG